MTCLPRANRRDAVEPAIVAALLAAGAYVVRVDKPVDLLVGYAARWHLLEVKTGRAPLTGPQKRLMADVRSGKCPVVHVVRSAAQALEAIGA